MVQSVVIVSKDKDFSASLAEQLALECGVICRIAETFGKPGTEDVVLAIAPEEAPSSIAPVLAVNKPVRLQALLNQVENALRARDEQMALGGKYVLWPLKKRLEAGEPGTDLTDKEVALLRFLVQAGKEGVARESLLKNVLGMDPDANTHTLETHIYRLRGKFKELGDEEMIVATKGGYALKTL